MRLLHTEYNPLRWQYWFGQVDTRPLSVFRIFIGALLLKNALYLLPLADWFYSDQGIVPRAALFDGLARADRFSLMDAVSTTWMAWLFIGAWALTALCLMVGYRTRWMAVLNFICILSVHERNLYILSSSDSLLRVLSFWLLFVPLSDYYSVDARRHPRPTPTTCAFPLRVLQIQVALVYVTTAWFKLIGAPWQQGTAFYTVLQLDTMLMPPAFWLRESGLTGLFPLFTYYTVICEVVFVPLVFFPFFQPLARKIGLTLVLLLHIGIGLILAIPDFPLLMPLTYVLFFETRWIMALENRVRRWRGLPPLSDAPVVADSSMRWSQGLVIAVQMVLLLGVIWWNLETSREYNAPIAAPLPAPLRSVVRYTGLWQYWDLFAPLPLQLDGWILIPARFEDGHTLDLRTGAPLSTDPPNLRFGPDLRWRKFEYNLNEAVHEPILLAWGRYYCRYYNETLALPMGQRLATLEIRFRYRRVVPMGEPRRPFDENLLWVHWCYDEYRYEVPSG